MLRHCGECYLHRIDRRIVDIHFHVSNLCSSSFLRRNQGVHPTCRSFINDWHIVMRDYERIVPETFIWMG